MAAGTRIRCGGLDGMDSIPDVRDEPGKDIELRGAADHAVCAG